jgi:hypothetical protein
MSAAQTTSGVDETNGASKPASTTELKRVPVFATKFAAAHPKPQNRVATQYMAVGDVMAREHPSDAHFAAYHSTLNRRLSKESVGVIPIVMLLLVADVDDRAAHAANAAASDRWRAGERAKIARLQEAYPGAFVYETRGGYRIVFLLPEPFPIANADDRARWSSHYLAFCRHLARQLDIYSDSRCKEWQRIFRAPNVVRDGKSEKRATYGDPYAIGMLRIDASPSNRPRGKRTAYVRTALLRAVENVRTAAIGTRNEVLNREAYALGGFVPHELDRDAVFDALLEAILANGGDPEIDASKIDAAIDAGMRAPRTTPEPIVEPRGAPGAGENSTNDDLEAIVVTDGFRHVAVDQAIRALVRSPGE